MAEVFKRARMTTPCLVVLEDLDAMIDDENRAFLLNELDGFDSNTGIVVLAATNHPESSTRLFSTGPAGSIGSTISICRLRMNAEFIEKWNEQLEVELRISQPATATLVRETEHFSFAYLKELFVGSLAQWMVRQGGESMDDILLAQSRLLSGQMRTERRRQILAFK